MARASRQGRIKEHNNSISITMAKETILNERGTGETLYPRTHASLVMTSSGASVDEALEGKAEKEAVYKVFDDAWIADGGTVIESGVSYGLNGLTLTLAEAIEVEKYASRYQADFASKLRNTTVRTNIVTFKSAYYMRIGISAFASNSEAEVLRLAPGDNKAAVGDSDEAFRNCEKLKTILNVMQDCNATAAMYWWRNAFRRCFLLETVKIEGLKGPVSFGDSPLLKLDSLQYTVEHVDTTAKSVVITVHPDVYAKLTGDTTNAACAVLTDEERAEWSALFETAASKNITIASA